MRRTSMRPTLLGVKAIVFYAVLVTAFFVAPYMNLFFLLLAFLTVLGTMAVLWNRSNLAGVSGAVVDVRPGPVGAGPTAEIRLTGNRTHYGLRVLLTLEDRTATLADVAILEGEVTTSGRLPSLPRGVHTITGASLVSVFPLGLVRRRLRIDAPDEAVVYPAPASLAESRSRNEILAELAGNTLAAAGDLGATGLRDYRDGDELRRVSWKATARRGTLIVREYESEAATALEVVLDLRADGDELEHALAVTVALADLARDEKEPFVLHTFDHSGTYGDGYRPRRELLRYLAATRSVGADGPPPPTGSPNVVRLPANAGSAR